jgi:hypothetical protein
LSSIPAASWQKKPPDIEANLEISSLLNISSGMRFEEKRKFGGGVDCSTQKENQHTLYNNNIMCANNNDFVTQHACPLARNIDLPFIP